MYGCMDIGAVRCDWMAFVEENCRERKSAWNHPSIKKLKVACTKDRNYFPGRVCENKNSR